MDSRHCHDSHDWPRRRQLQHCSDHWPFLTPFLSCWLLPGSATMTPAVPSAYFNPNNPHGVYMPMVGRWFGFSTIYLQPCFCDKHSWLVFVLFFCLFLFLRLTGAAAPVRTKLKLSWKEKQLRLRLQHFSDHGLLLFIFYFPTLKPVVIFFFLKDL